MSARLLMIGIDGADAQWLDRKSADGSLPHLAALRANGAAHQLRSLPGITDDAIWASFQYEVELGEHGRFNYRLPLGDGQLGWAHEAEESRPAFWDDLSREGMRVAVIDVPKCRAPRPLNGIHLTDWSVHGRYFPQPQSQPASLAADVLEKFGPAQPSRCSAYQPFLEDGDVRDITSHLRASVAQKRAAGVHYLESEPWDLFVIGFKEAHCVSHAFWDFEDGHPAYDPARTARFEHPVTKVLQDIDDAIGALVASAGPGAEVVIFSTTEYAPNGSIDHLMPGIVKRLNAHFAASPIRRAGRLFEHLLPSGTKTPLDWRIASLPYNENCSALRVVRSRKPKVAHGDQLPDDAILQAIEAELNSLRDADTGRPIISAITRPSSDLTGLRAKTLPDLLIHCTDGLIPRAVVSKSLGRITARPPSLRTGNHVAGGFLFGAGRRASASIDDVESIADLGPLARKVLASASLESDAGSQSSVVRMGLSEVGLENHAGYPAQG